MVYLCYIYCTTHKKFEYNLVEKPALMNDSFVKRTNNCVAVGAFTLYSVLTVIMESSLEPWTCVPNSILSTWASCQISQVRDASN